MIFVKGYDNHKQILFIKGHNVTEKMIKLLCVFLFQLKVNNNRTFGKTFMRLLNLKELNCEIRDE